MARLRVPIEMRWGDVDAYGHVNNVQFARILEEARVRTLWSDAGPTQGLCLVHDGGEVEPVSDGRFAAVRGGPGGDTATLVAQQLIDYLVPLQYTTAPVMVDVWVSSLKAASLTVDYEVIDASGGVPGLVVARAFTVLVLADLDTMAPRRMTAGERSAWLPLVGPPVKIRWRSDR